MPLKFGSISPDYNASHSFRQQVLGQSAVASLLPDSTVSHFTRQQVPEKQLFVSQLSEN